MPVERYRSFLRDIRHGLEGGHFPGIASGVLLARSLFVVFAACRSPIDVLAESIEIWKEGV